MKSIRYKQIKTQLTIHTTAQQLDVKVSHLPNDRANTPTAFEYVKCTTPKTFSQKLHQFHDLKVEEKLEQALENRVLAIIKKLLNKVFEKSTDG